MRSKLFVFVLLSALLCGTVGTSWANSQGQPEGLPDLVVQVEFDSATGWVDVRVRNVGTGYAGGFRSYLYIDPLQQPPGLNTPDTSRSYLFGLAPGDSYTWSYGPWTPTPGQHVMWAWVDRDNAVMEEDDFNNFGFFLVGAATPTPTPTPTATSTATPRPLIRSMFLPLILRGATATPMATATPTATQSGVITPESRAMATPTP